ncbi:hypothetical protein [Paractinoplanes durhamensis]|uniref:hypothetical protein n=1 Tax=Paractinoplanes durhamensis TaxID=113563 RepID=UPI0036425BE2
MLQPTPAAAGSITTSARLLNGNINLLSLVTADLGALNPGQTWTTGQSAHSGSLAKVGLLPSSVLNLGAVTETAGPATNGGMAEAKTAGLSLLGSNGVTTGPITAGCQMTKQDITTTMEIVNLRVGGASKVAATGTVGLAVPNLLTVDVDKRVGTYSSGTGELTYNVKAIDVTLLQGALGLVANGNLTVAEAQCKGIVKLGSISTSKASLAPGESGTPKVIVTNTGDIAAPNTTITIPLPGSQYALAGLPTVTGGGTCEILTTAVKCTGVTVPGGGSAEVSLPVTLASSAGAGAASWSPTGINASSVPIPQSPATVISAPSGSGLLVDPQAPVTKSGTVTVNATTLGAGKTGAPSVSITNDGPSDASATVTIPITSPPGGVEVVSAAVGSKACTVTRNVSIVCTGVPVPAKGTARVDINTSAAVTTTPGATWDLTGITADLNGKTVTGAGRLLTIGAPDVNLNGGVIIRPATATPGGPQVTATVRVTNAGTSNAGPTTITLPAPPTGYTVGTVTTDGGGTCATTSAKTIVCTGVTIPGSTSGARTVVVSIPVTVAAGVTTDWTAAGTSPVTAQVTGADSAATGTATGTIVSAVPSYTLGVHATGPADGTVSPGGSTSMTVDIANQGPSDAVGAQFVVVAPQNTTFGTLADPAKTACTAVAGSATALRCTMNLTAGGAATSLVLPLTVAQLANPATPVAGGCVSLDNDTACGGTSDKELPTFTLRTPLAGRLGIDLVPAAVTKGSTTAATGQVKLTSTQAETGLKVTIPLADKQSFVIGSVTGPSGSTCTYNATAITCTGVNLTANTPATIGVNITAPSSAANGLTWSPTVTVLDGTDPATKSGPLAGTGPGYNLSATVTPPADGTVLPGGTTGLQVAVTNAAGSSAAAPAVFTVNAPAGTTFGTPLPSGAITCTANGANTQVTCQQALAAGATTGPLTFPLKIDAGADPDVPVAGGCVDLDGITGCGPADTTIPTFTLKVPFAARAVVTADQAAVTPGDQATATVHLKAAHGPLNNVTVTIPTGGLTGTGLTIVSGTGPAGANCDFTASPITCDHVSVLDGATADIGLVVAAPSNATTGTTWTATGVTAALGTDSVSTDLTLAAVGAAKPKIVATSVTLGSATLLPGEATTLDVALTNQGPSDATGATVNLIAPAGATFGTVPAGSNCVANVAKTKLACPVSLAKGAPWTYSFPLSVSAIAIPGVPLSGGCVDLDGNNLCTAADAPIPTISVGTPAQHRIIVAVLPAAVTPGDTGTAKVSITSTQAETGLKVTIPLTGIPSGVDVTTATWPTGHTCTVNAGVSIVCDPVDLPTPGVPVVITAGVKADPDAAAGVWTAGGITVDAGSGNGGAATDSAVVAVISTAKISLSGLVSVPTGTKAGDTANVSVTIGNAGPSDANDAVVTVTAPTGTTFDTLTAPTSADCTLTLPTLATCKVDVAANGTQGYLFPVQIPADADVFAQVKGGCIDLDGVPGCDLPITPIDLAVSIGQRVAVGAAGATLTPGDTGGADAQVRITATHDTLSSATVVIPLALPAGMHLGTVTPSAGTCQINAGDVTCSGMTVSGGTTETVTLHLTADADVVPGTRWTSTGITVTEGSLTTDPVNRVLATAGARRFTLAPAITTPADAEPGKATSFDVQVTNQGPSAAANATFSILAPAGTTFGALGTATDADCDVVSTTKVTCTVASLASGAAKTYTLPLTVDAAAGPGSQLTGGCFDGDNNGYCTTAAAPPDQKIPAFAVATPFAKQITVSTSPFTGNTDGDAQLVISSDRAQTGLVVFIPAPALGTDVLLDAATPPRFPPPTTATSTLTAAPSASGSMWPASVPRPPSRFR